MKHRRMFKPATKAEMIANLNRIFNAFYGCNTTVSKRVERFSKERIARLDEIARLWKNDPIADQVRILEAWME